MNNRKNYIKPLSKIKDLMLNGDIPLVKEVTRNNKSSLWQTEIKTVAITKTCKITITEGYSDLHSNNIIELEIEKINGERSFISITYNFDPNKSTVINTVQIKSYGVLKDINPSELVAFIKACLWSGLYDDYYNSDKTIEIIKEWIEELEQLK